MHTRDAAEANTGKRHFMQKLQRKTQENCQYIHTKLRNVCLRFSYDSQCAALCFSKFCISMSEFFSH